MRVAYQEQPWLSLFFYPYKRDCSADYVEQTEYDSDSENMRIWSRMDMLMIWIWKDYIMKYICLMQERLPQKNGKRSLDIL